MTATIRLGKVFGIAIGANWSLIFIFALIAWTLATIVLPAASPRQSAAAYWGAGIAGVLVFYVGLLAHELSHSLVARRAGVKVKGITLWMFGGVSQLEGEPGSARAEALITAVGPVTSLILAVVAFMLALATAALNAPNLVVYLLLWLAYVNAALGVFNLIPAFPLDGGRLLASLLWWRSGSRLQGLHQAVLVGRVFAFLMIAAGVYELFTGSVLNGIWIAFIGWFLLSAASAEETGATTKALLTGVRVSAAMTSPVVTLPDRLTVEEFLSTVALGYRHTTYPLQDPAGRLTGVTRLRDLLRVPEREQRERRERRLRDCARPIEAMPQAAPGDDLEGTLERIGPENLELRVLVFDHGELVGILSPNDVARLVTLRQAAGGGQRAA